MIKKLLLLTVFVGAAIFSVAQPTFTWTPGNGCYNSSANTITVGITTFTPGVTSYSWTILGSNCNGVVLSTAPTGSSAVLQVTCCGMYTINMVTTYTNSSTSITTNTVNRACPPNIVISTGPNPMCAGNTNTLTASGAATYSWSTGFNGATIIVSPSVSTCYTVGGTNVSGCTSFATSCLTLSPFPSVSVNTPPAFCEGGTAVLTPSGAVMYTVQPGNYSGFTFTVMPLVSTCFTVTGYNGTCAATAVSCLTVAPAPTLAIAGGNTVCLGSSRTLTVSGATTYTWMSPLTYGGTKNVLPTAYTVYTVFGTGINGCTKMDTISITPLSSCALVWPGDANSDGVVNTTDVLELGLYAGATGPVRSGASITYNSQFANAWTGSGSNSQNKVHIDCNGDGSVNSGDTLAILNNFSLTHTFKKSSGSSQAGDITLVPAGSYFNGTWASIDVMLGSSSNNISNIYGVAFDVAFDNPMVDNNQVYVKYTSSFLNAGNQNIPFRRIANGSGLANCATVRVDHTNVSGNGKIAELWFKLAPGVTGPMNFSASNVIKIDAGGIKNGLAGSTASVNVTTMQVGLQGQQNSVDAFTLYPNPANTELYVLSTISESVSYTICDVTGRQVLKGSFISNSKIQTSALSTGTYLITFEANGQKSCRKLLVEH